MKPASAATPAASPRKSSRTSLAWSARDVTSRSRSRPRPRRRFRSHRAHRHRELPDAELLEPRVREGVVSILSETASSSHEAHGQSMGHEGRPSNDRKAWLQSRRLWILVQRSFGLTTSRGGVRIGQSNGWEGATAPGCRGEMQTLSDHRLDALTMTTMPALRASGSSGQAATTAYLIPSVRLFRRIRPRPAWACSPFYFDQPALDLIG